MAGTPELARTRGTEWRAWLAPIAAVVALLIGLSVVIALSNRSAGTDAPPPVGPVTLPQPVHPSVAYDVGQVTGDTARLDISGGSAAPASASSRDIALTGDTLWEFLENATIDDITVGDRVQVIGVPNQVRSFHLRSVIVMPAEGVTEDEDGAFRSAGGFTGGEASRDPEEAPILQGTVESVSAEQVVIGGPTGPITIALSEGAPIRRIVPDEPSRVRDGDRIAFAPTDGQPASVLVFPGGARE